MGKLEQFIHAVRLNPASVDATILYQELYEGATREVIPDKDPYIYRMHIADYFDRMCFEEFSLLDLDNLEQIKEAVFHWSPIYKNDEDQQNEGFFQGALLSFFNRQLEIRQLFSTLSASLSEGENIFQEKIEQLKLDPIENEKKIEILERALGRSNQAASYYMVGSDKQTFKGLSAQLKSLAESPMSISPVVVKQVQTNYISLINDKLVIPFVKYREERGFVKRVKDWMNDTIKKIFGSNSLSTKSVMSDAIKQQTTLFSDSKARADYIFPLEIKNNK
ncbi:MAG: hypothetical protein WAW86_08795 [Gammaproteobacteria bacterium]